MVRAAAGVVTGAVVSASLAGCVEAPRVAPDQLRVQQETAALIHVVTDMASLVPAEVRDEPNRLLASEFQNAKPRRAVPDAAREASGLPLFESLPDPWTETFVVLNLFEPRVVGHDSIDVYAEWLVFDGTADGGSWWGQDWRYLLSCDSTCVPITRRGPGHLN